MRSLIENIRDQMNNGVALPPVSSKPKSQMPASLIILHSITLTTMQHQRENKPYCSACIGMSEPTLIIATFDPLYQPARAMTSIHPSLRLLYFSPPLTAIQEVDLQAAAFMLQNVRNQLLPCLDGGRSRGRRELSAPVLRSHSMPIRFTEEHQRYLGEVENEREDHPMRRLPMSESAKAAAVASMERQQQVRGCMAFIKIQG